MIKQCCCIEKNRIEQNSTFSVSPAIHEAVSAFCNSTPCDRKLHSSHMLRERGRPGHKTMSYHKDGWMDEKMNGQMDKCTYVVSLSRAKLDPSGPQTTCAIRRSCESADALR